MHIFELIPLMAVLSHFVTLRKCIVIFTCLFQTSAQPGHNDKQWWLLMSLWWLTDLFSKVELVPQTGPLRSYLLCGFIMLMFSWPRLDWGRWDILMRGMHRERGRRRGREWANGNKILHFGINQITHLGSIVLLTRVITGKKRKKQ